MANVFLAGQRNEVPQQIIIMWSGAVNEIPSGWALCDGNNGTPNLKDKFIIGAGSTYAVGTTGGATTQTVANHSHTASGSLTSSTSGISGYFNMDGTLEACNADHYHEFSIGLSSTGGYTLNTLPPYYAICYIMKL